MIVPEFSLMGDDDYDGGLINNGNEDINVGGGDTDGDGGNDGGTEAVDDEEDKESGSNDGDEDNGGRVVKSNTAQRRQFTHRNMEKKR